MSPLPFVVGGGTVAECGFLRPAGSVAPGGGCRPPAGRWSPAARDACHRRTPSSSSSPPRACLAALPFTQYHFLVFPWL